MTKRMKVNLILLAMMVLPPLSSLLLRYERSEERRVGKECRLLV